MPWHDLQYIKRGYSSAMLAAYNVNLPRHQRYNVMGTKAWAQTAELAAIKHGFLVITYMVRICEEKETKVTFRQPGSFFLSSCCSISFLLLCTLLALQTHDGREIQSTRPHTLAWDMGWNILEYTPTQGHHENNENNCKKHQARWRNNPSKRKQ